MKIKIKLRGLIVVGLISLPGLSFCQKAEVFSSHDGAIRGYDPVAYFKDGKAVRGKPGFNYTWNAAIWYFSSAENRDLFKADPMTYAPQYGGYCAFGIAEGHKAPTQPEAWTIVDKKLYLNYNLDVRAKWRNDQKEFIEKADSTWSAVKLTE